MRQLQQHSMPEVLVQPAARNGEGWTLFHINQIIKLLHVVFQTTGLVNCWLHAIAVTRHTDKTTCKWPCDVTWCDKLMRFGLELMAKLYQLLYLPGRIAIMVKPGLIAVICLRTWLEQSSWCVMYGLVIKRALLWSSFIRSGCLNCTELVYMKQSAWYRVWNCAILPVYLYIARLLIDKKAQFLETRFVYSKNFNSLKNVQWCWRIHEQSELIKSCC